MADTILFPEWRKQNETTKYPFSDRATLENVDGRRIVNGTFIDAALYPTGVAAGLYLSQVVITHQTATLTLGVPGSPAVATGSFELVSQASDIIFTDASGRPAGLLISEPQRLSIFQTWGVGTYEFLPAEAEFAATVCFPTPEVGVRGILLDDGSLMTGDVWLVGSDGVVLRVAHETLPASRGKPERTVQVIRVDVVGDPLFRRRLCQPTNLFTTPRFIKTIRIEGPNQTFECSPDQFGDLKIAVNNDLADDTVLRITPVPNGLKVSAVGTTTNL